MLTITIPGDEFWDDEAEIFRHTESTTLEFEHSLVSLSKWEARFHKLFLTPDAKTVEEMHGYVEAMLLTPDAKHHLENLRDEHLIAIDNYINDPMTGTTLANVPEERGRTAERLSSELIYFWMSQFQIDKDCEHWHLNRLFTLIRVHHAKSQKPKKMSRKATAQSMAEINAQRKARMGTSG